MGDFACSADPRVWRDAWVDDRSEEFDRSRYAFRLVWFGVRQII